MNNLGEGFFRDSPRRRHCRILLISVSCPVGISCWRELRLVRGSIGAPVRRLPSLRPVILLSEGRPFRLKM